MIGDDPALRAAYGLCRRRTREQDPAEYALIQLVPAALRPACWALWAAASALDDLGDDRTAPAAERAARVEEWITALHRELPAGTSPDPVRHALADTAARWRLDLSELHGAMVQVQDDTHGRHFPDWAAWRTWGRDNLLPWFGQVRTLFDRAGVPVALRLDCRETYEEFLDGVRLTDILTDLSADLAQGDLLLPEEAVRPYPGAADDLAHRRWSPAVAALVTQLTGLARQWVTQDGLSRGMHPGPAEPIASSWARSRAAMVCRTVAGPGCMPRLRPSWVTHWRARPVSCVTSAATAGLQRRCARSSAAPG
nr:squalene/phytoene synthase family protein [Streptomyces africanus]